jgi:hypothetical protein
MAEFAWNNEHNSYTGMTPFYALYGYHPSFEPRLSEPSSNPSAKDMADTLKEIREDLRAELLQAQTYMAKYYDKKHTAAPNFNPQDLMWLLRRNITTLRPSIIVNWDFQNSRTTKRRIIQITITTYLITPPPRLSCIIAGALLAIHYRGSRTTTTPSCGPTTR